MITKLCSIYKNSMTQLQKLDFIAPLMIRLYLIPIFWMAGINKFQHFDSTAMWFGNMEWGLGLPYPEVMAGMAAGTEILGAVCLLLGFATRLITIPLLFTMLIAIIFVHWDNGWFAIASHSSESAQRLTFFLDWLQETDPERYEYITELRQPVALNNGVEFAVTYAIMLITLFFTGAGRFFSLDYWISKRLNKKTNPA